ncbi:MAG: TRAP transporter large permease subunit [Dehalococcoidia bacterium]
MPIDLVTATILIFGSLILLMALSLPIAFTLGLVGFLGLYFLASPTVAVRAVGIQIYSVPTSFTLLAAPLFILMAQIIILSGLGARLFSAMERMLSGTPAALALASLGAGTVFAAATGSSTASCATIGPVALAEMKKRRYDLGFAAGAVAGAGGLAIVIPPSVPMIVYGFVTETSVAKLFLAGFLPGILMASFMAIYAMVRVWRNPKIAPPTPGLPLKERFKALLEIWPLLVLITMVLGSMYGGIATPTEAAAVGVLGSLLLAVLYGGFTLGKLKDALVTTAHTTSFVFTIVVGALVFGFLLSYLRLPEAFSEAVVRAGLEPWQFLLAVNILLLILGCLMDGLTILLVAIPIVVPPLLAAGYDPIWLGLVLIINIEIGMLTPPVGMNLFVISGIGKPFGLTFDRVARGAFPFILAQMAAWILVMLIPDIALWLPRTM